MSYVLLGEGILMAKCKYCGFDVEDRAGYCPHCGAKTVQTDEQRVFNSNFADARTWTANPAEETPKSKNDNLKKKRIPVGIVAVMACLVLLGILYIIRFSGNGFRSVNNGGQMWEENMVPTATTIPTSYVVPYFATRNEAKHREFYVSNDGELFYYETYDQFQSGWWKYDMTAGTWSQSTEHESYDDEFLFGLSYVNAIGGEEELRNWLIANGKISKSTELRNTPYYLFSCHDYIDAFPKRPERGYYVTGNGDTYYFLHAGQYGIAMGSAVKNIGWYYYDVVNGWRFFSDGSSRIEVGDELWYDQDNCYAGEMFEEYKVNGKNLVSGDVVWNSAKFATDFSKTKEYIELRNNSAFFDN